jgi:hypothetical protein
MMKEKISEAFPRRRGRNGADTDVYPSRRRRAFRRMAQIFQPGS